MRTRLFVSLISLAAVAAHARPGAAQCTTDTDCKGDRICEGGSCVSPPAAPAPAAWSAAPAPAPAPVAPKARAIAPFDKGYLELAAMVGVGSWGQKRITSSDDDVQDQAEDAGVDARSAGTGPFGGVYVAPRYALSEALHLGLYFRAGKGESVGVRIEDSDAVEYDDNDLDDIGHLHLGVGGSLKFGAMAGRRVWIGGGVDLGFHVTKIEDGELFIVGGDDPEKYYGFELLPRFCVDVFLFNIAGFKMSIPISVGAAVVPFAKWKPSNEDVEDAWDDQEAYVWAWQIEPLIMVGLALGA